MPMILQELVKSVQLTYSAIHARLIWELLVVFHVNMDISSNLIILALLHAININSKIFGIIHVILVMVIVEIAKMQIKLHV